MKDHEKKEFTAALDRRQILLGAVVLLSMALLLIIGLTPRTAQAPSAQTGADPNAALGEGCQVIQHLAYTPCGHELTRRVPLPTELVGHSRQDLEAAYDVWQVTAFASAEVAMEQQVPIYCPEHLVLRADGSGMLCVWQNQYGDAYALLRDLALPLTDLPETTQATLREGLAFNTEPELSAYLESIES